MRATDYMTRGAKLRADGFTTRQIITEWASEQGLNPRTAARLSHGMSQQQVADAWNAQRDTNPDHVCTRKDISNWETTRQPSLDALNRLARIFRCSAGDLLGGEDHSHLDGPPSATDTAALSVAICVVIDAAHVLLVRQRGGDYQFPTGMVKPGADARERAMEECAAETGARVAITNYLGGRVHPVTAVRCEYFVADYLAGALVNGQPAENSDVTWAPIAQLDRFIPQGRIFGPVLDVLENQQMQQPTSESVDPTVATAVVVSDRGVLLAARHDGKPPWTFPGGGIETGEDPTHAAVREVKEETGLAVQPVRELGRRVHPKTGTGMAYVLCEPVNGLEVHVGEPDDLAEVAWTSRGELDERIPEKHLFDPVRQHLAGAL